MGEVLCLYGWNETKARQLESWVQAHEQRYVLFFEDKLARVIWNTHPRIRCLFVPLENEREIFERIAWEFLYLPFAFEEARHPVFQRFTAVQSEIGLRAFDFADQGVQLLQNFRSNLSKPFYLARDLYGKFEGRPALVCGGGPSLTGVASHLKRLQDQALILGCGAGAEALLKMGVRPHFGAHVDAACFHRFTAAEVPLFFQLRTDPAVVAKYKGLHFLVEGTGNFPLESGIQEQLGLAPSFDGGWTVGTFGVALATLLGCSPIILVGIDLATSQGQLYAPGVKTTSSTERFLPTKNRQGESTLSRADWVLAAAWLEKFAASHPDRKWGTVSKRGLEISTIPLLSLDAVVGSAGVMARIEELLQQSTPIQWAPLWTAVGQGLSRCHEICQKILQEMEKIFPSNPQENGTCALLEHDLGEERVFLQVLEPLWRYWSHVLQRHNTAGEWGLYLNRILFFQSLCEKFREIR